MQKIELLAPAGSYEKAKVAFMYGADAVYVGTSNTSLRSRSEVTLSDLKELIKYAHGIGKKVYAAINIYAEDECFDEIIDEAKELDANNVDGIIVSDVGVLDTIKKYAPHTDIHISTQANTVSYRACNFWYNEGAKRVILGRELSKDRIKTILKNKPKDLETEIFVHGAVCFGYSGRCFLSKYLAGRNGNLGDCVQSCRWKYNLYAEEVNNPGSLMPVEYDNKGTYIFSSKDLCLIKELPEIIDMGIDSIKIEGRLKTEHYLATVINSYRCAIDDYIRDPKSYDYKKYLTELDKTKTRGLTTFYFNDKSNQDIEDLDGMQYNDKYEFGGIVKEILKDRIIVEIRNKLSLDDKLEVILPNNIKPYKFKIEKMWDIETKEEIDTVNPGKYGQRVIINKPKVELNEGYVLRRKKN